MAFAAGVPGLITGAVAKAFPSLMQRRRDQQLQREVEHQRQLADRVMHTTWTRLGVGGGGACVCVRVCVCVCVCVRRQFLALFAALQ